MKPRIEIEPDFDAFVRRFGGRVLRDELPRSPVFANADYYFPEANVIAELKCLEKNKVDDPATQNKLRRLWIKWRQRGDVTGSVPDVIHSRDYPVRCQQEMYAVYSVPVKRRITKANRQIRETRAYLNQPKAKGLLLLANDGNMALEPAALTHILFTTLAREFTAIDSFIFFTANYWVRSTHTDKQTLLWTSGYFDETRTVSEDFIRVLFEGWSSYVEKMQSVSIEKIYTDSMEDLMQMKYFR